MLIECAQVNMEIGAEPPVPFEVAVGDELPPDLGKTDHKLAVTVSGFGE